MVVGQDRDAARYEAQARRAGIGARVRFVGAREDVRPYYAAADCFVLPSRYDPFPEHCARGARHGAAGDRQRALRHGRSTARAGGGFVTPPDDTMDLARALHQADRALRGGGLQRAARATAEQFGIDGMARQLVELYEQLAQLAQAARVPGRQGI